MSGQGAVVAVPTSGLFRLDVRRVEEIMRDRGIECDVSRHGRAVLVEVETPFPGGGYPLLKNLETAIEKQLNEAGLVKREKEWDDS